MPINLQRPATRYKLANMLSQLLAASAMITVSTAAPAQASASGYAAIPLLWEYGNLPKITTNIVWGTPGQNASVPTIFDTGSSAFWVAGPNNVAYYGTKYTGEEGPCNETLTPYYDWTISQTHTAAVDDTQSFLYAGNAHAVYSYYTMNDTVSFPQPGYPQLQNRRVAVSNQTNYASGATTTCDGYSMDVSILGMSSTSMFRSDLLADGLVSSNTLSMWFDTAPEDYQGTFSGTALVGALPPSSKYTGELVKVDAQYSGGNYYLATPTFKGKGLDANGSTTAIPVTTEVPTCLVDTGSPNLELPITTDITNITGLTTIPYTSVLAYNGSCESIPATATLDLEWSNVTISIPYKNLMRGYLDGVEPGYCVLSVFLEEVSCTLGAPFFSAAAIAFDDTVNEVYLAQGGVSTGAADGISGFGTVVPLQDGQ